MIKTTSITLLLITASVSVCMAGSINNNVWSPSACGNEPEIPVIKKDNIEQHCSRGIGIVRSVCFPARQFP